MFFKYSAAVLTSFFVSLSGCSTVISKKNDSVNQNCSPASLSLQKIERAEAAAVAKAFIFLQCLDGGNLEDLYRSLGIAFTQDPAVVVEQMQHSKVHTSVAMPMFTMLPLSFVDNACGSETELLKRADIVRTSLLDSETKSAYLSAIDESAERERKHCKTN